MVLVRIGASGQSHWQKTECVPTKTLLCCVRSTLVVKQQGIGRMGSAPSRRNKSVAGGAAGGETTVAVVRLQHFSGSPVDSCAAHSVLWNSRNQMCRGRAGQGRPGHAWWQKR